MKRKQKRFAPLTGAAALIACAFVAPAQGDEERRRETLPWRDYRVTLTAGEAELDGALQRLSGGVRLELHDPAGTRVVVATAERAQAGDDGVMLEGDVRLEVGPGPLEVGRLRVLSGTAHAGRVRIDRGAPPGASRLGGATALEAQDLVADLRLDGGIDAPEHVQVELATFRVRLD